MTTGGPSITFRQGDIVLVPFQDMMWEAPVKEPVSIAQFIRAIRELPSDEPRDDPRVWYTTQKQHWLGWLSEYDGPGAYGRVSGRNRDARFAYNHIVEPQMLLWLIAAAGVRPALVESARQASAGGTTLMQQSGIIRRHVPWEEVASAIWGSDRRAEEHPSTDRYTGS